MPNATLSYDLLARIAMEHFSPLFESPHRVASIKDLARRHKMGRNAVSAAIRQACELKLIEIHKSERAMQALARPTRDEQLEDALQSRYASLRRAIVVNTAEHGSDLVHRDLGYAMARELGSHVDDGATVGLGSGRGPYYTVMGCSHQTRLSRDGVTLMSLTGAVYPQSHDESLNVLLDADFHTGLAGVCFSKPLHQRMVSYPIAPDDIERVRSETWLDDEHFKAHTPTVAIVGVGVLRDRHRFYQAVRSERAGDGLKPILGDLKRLVALTDRHSHGHYCPVADICNRLFYIEPPLGMSIPAADVKDIETAVARINSRLLTVSHEQLQRIGGLLLVAGTPAKALAIRELLQEGELASKRVRVKVVCVDARTAEVVLGVQPARAGARRRVA